LTIFVTLAYNSQGHGWKIHKENIYLFFLQKATAAIKNNFSYGLTIFLVLTNREIYTFSPSKKKKKTQPPFGPSFIEKCLV